MAPSAAQIAAVPANMNVDYVISYRFATADKSVAIAQFQKLLQALAGIGLATEVRTGDNHSLLVFVKVASQDHLYGEVYRSRVNDWTHGVRTAAPEKETRKALESDPLYEAERLRIIYQLITNSKAEGGAGITPKQDEWECVESIFPLHDHEYNTRWIKQWSSSYVLKPADLDAIRDRFGEQVAFYFAFTQSYFAFLTFPALFGFAAWILLGHFSPIYAVVNCLWCIVFTEYWKHQEVDLAIRWGVRGVSKIELQRKEFKHQKEIVDPVTGQKVRFFPSTTRLLRQLLQIPFALGASLVLGSLIATCFGIEIFISEIYDGPLKTILVFLPTGILTTVLPVLTSIFTKFATQLTEFENYETRGAYETALTQKLFVLNLITSYLGIFLTAFVYVPFGTLIIPYLDIFSLTVRPFAEHEKQMQVPKTGFTIDENRLRKQVIYFAITAQVVNLCMELIVPYLKRRGFTKIKEMQSDYAMKRGGAAPQASENDIPDEAAFLARVRKEAELDTYDVTSDLREMVIQFGYLSLFSVVWPLVGCSYLVNDWIELRADALKICVEMRRPIPWRADTIGSWLDSLSFLTWLGSITTSALVYMFRNDGLGPGGTPDTIKCWALLLTIFFSEHIFLSVRWAVRVAISKIESPGLQKERRQRFLVRQTYVQESLTELEKKPGLKDLSMSEEQMSDRAAQEEKARQGTLGTSTVEERFWQTQRGWRAAAKVGADEIERTAPETNETKKEL